MELSKHYDPSTVEKKWYTYWLGQDYFSSEPDSRDPYTIVIPPPNVTGVLHMGHILNATIQDVLIRKARKENKNALWVPGMDHASIATEAKVVRWLREEKGLTKGDISREKFIDYAWQWTDKYGGIILEQLKLLGASCDWSRTAFTLDDVRSRMVLQAFVDLYERDLLYRGKRMVNWDPEAQTVLSNEEVLYSEEKGELYFVKYKVVGEDEYLLIATTRPETILGDTAVAVHPEDERYHHLMGKEVEVPLTGRAVAVIADEYVQRDFGSGALKVTPAHDTNDYELGKRHQLKTLDIFNDDGTINEVPPILNGLDRYEARREMVKKLKEDDLLEKVEEYVHNVGRSERTSVIIEPRLSQQWYVRMKEMAKTALAGVQDRDILFFPENMVNTYRHWMDNIRDWCISRQLWWGHRIPVWYWKEHVIVAIDEESALEKGRQLPGGEALTLADLHQDEDVLDTWFSSWLWPMSVFGDFDNENEEVRYYYPTTVLVTGWDIIFLWVARMIMAGYEWKDERPFSHVYFTGMVRDKQRRKMSKSLGNSPDAIELINTFGADGVRFGMLSCSPAGGDILFEEKLCEQGRNFCNKMWNALRLISTWKDALSQEAPSEHEKVAGEWFEYKLYQMAETIEQDFLQYRLSEALIKIYSLVWTEFCSWYLEMIKPGAEEKISRQTFVKSCHLYEQLMSMLHPFMPFITEEITAQLRSFTGEESLDCIISPPPVNHGYDEQMLKEVEALKDLTTAVRDLRNQHQIRQRETVELYFQQDTAGALFHSVEGYMELLVRMSHLSKYTAVGEAPDGSVVFQAGTGRYYFPVAHQIDREKEVEKVQADLKHARGFVRGVEKKLNNEKFVANAPEAVVAKERKKLEDGNKRVAQLEENLSLLEEMREYPHG